METAHSSPENLTAGESNQQERPLSFISAEYISKLQLISPLSTRTKALKKKMSDQLSKSEQDSHIKATMESIPKIAATEATPEDQISEASKQLSLDPQLLSPMRATNTILKSVDLSRKIPEKVKVNLKYESQSWSAADKKVLAEYGYVEDNVVKSDMFLAPPSIPLPCAGAKTRRPQSDHGGEKVSTEKEPRYQLGEIPKQRSWKKAGSGASDIQHKKEDLATLEDKHVKALQDCGVISGELCEDVLRLKEEKKKSQEQEKEKNY